MDHTQVRRSSHWRSLVRKSEFQKVYEQGVKWVGRFVVVYLLVPQEAAPLFGAGSTRSPDTAWAVVASKKVGNAVARNRAKRLLREARRLGVLGEPVQLSALRETYWRTSGRTRAKSSALDDANHDFMLNEESGLWVVLVARQRILGASSREVREELDALLGADPQPH